MLEESFKYRMLSEYYDRTSSRLFLLDFISVDPKGNAELREFRFRVEVISFAAF